MTRFILVLVAFFLAFAINPAFGQDSWDSEIKLDMYGSYRDTIPMADVTETEILPSNRRRRGSPSGLQGDESQPGKKLAIASSQHQFSGTMFALTNLSGGWTEIISSPKTRDGGGPFASLSGRVEWQVGTSEVDSKTGRSWVNYLGFAYSATAFEFAERNYRARGAFVGVGPSFTIVHADGTPNFYGDEIEENLGLMVWNVNAMVAYRREWGETKRDNFELDYDEAYGIRLETTFLTYVTRQVLDMKEFETSDGRIIYGIDAILPQIELTGFVFFPLKDDRKDSLVGVTSEGPTQFHGIGRINIDLATVYTSFFGNRMQVTPGIGASVRFQERLFGSNTNHKLTWDPGALAQLKFTVGESVSFSLFGELVSRQHDGRAHTSESVAGIVGFNLSVTFGSGADD